MRDTSDMIEDALSEDTLMECEDGEGGLENLVHLATKVADSSPTIRVSTPMSLQNNLVGDAAERLLTLLGVGDEQEELLSSSEDEGVELVDELEDDDDEDQEDSRLLHQLAASLAMELKQSHQKQTTTRLSAGDQLNRDSISYVEHSSYLQEQNFKGMSCYRNNVSDKCQTQDSLKQNDVMESYQCLDGRLGMNLEPDQGSISREEDPSSWSMGWDACATEALRYLIEDEGLPPYHPTVLAMKDHLELQRERAFAQYTT